MKILDLFMRTEGELRFASTPRIGLESAALHACEQNTGADNSSLLERIAELEAKLSILEAGIASGAIAAKPAEEAPRKQQAPAAAAEETDALEAFLAGGGSNIFVE